MRDDILLVPSAVAPKTIFRVSRLVAALMFGGLMLFPAIGADSVRVGAYDFSYITAGHASVRPVQVFDDGRSTYMQFRPGMAVPAIFSSKDGAPRLLVPVQEGPYIKVPDLHGQLVLQVGRAQAQVIHSGGTRPDAAELRVNTPAGQQPYVAGSPYPRNGELVASLAPIPLTNLGAPAIVDDALERNSYATPRKGDNLVWQRQAEPRREEREVWFQAGSAALSPDARRSIASIAKSLPAGARVTVIGRDDETFKEGLDRARASAVRDALVKAGVSADRVVLRQGSAGKQSGKLWASTVVIEGAAEEWAAPAPRRSTAVLENLQALVRAGALRLDQAEAIARSHNLGPVAPAAAPAQAQTPPVAATQVAAAAADARRAGAPAAPVNRAWEMRKADGNVERMLTRWASEAGWTLVWREAPAIAVTGDMQLPPSDFLTAADAVVRRAQEVGYRISATAYSNQTLVVQAAK